MKNADLTIRGHFARIERTEERWRDRNPDAPAPTARAWLRPRVLAIIQHGEDPLGDDWLGWFTDRMPLIRYTPQTFIEGLRAIVAGIVDEEADEREAHWPRKRCPVCGTQLTSWRLDMHIEDRHGRLARETLRNGRAARAKARAATSVSERSDASVAPLSDTKGP